MCNNTSSCLSAGGSNLGNAQMRFKETKWPDEKQRRQRSDQHQAATLAPGENRLLILRTGVDKGSGSEELRKY